MVPASRAGEAAVPARHTHPDAWALMGAIEIAYLFAVRRRAGGNDGVDGAGGAGGVGGATRRQVGLFSAGVAVLLLASDWPIHDLAEGYLYSVHMVQHM